MSTDEVWEYVPIFPLPFLNDLTVHRNDYTRVNGFWSKGNVCSIGQKKILTARSSQSSEHRRTVSFWEGFLLPLRFWKRKKWWMQGNRKVEVSQFQCLVSRSISKGMFLLFSECRCMHLRSCYSILLSTVHLWNQWAPVRVMVRVASCLWSVQILAIPALHKPFPNKVTEGSRGHQCKWGQ